MHEPYQFEFVNSSRIPRFTYRYISPLPSLGNERLISVVQKKLLIKASMDPWICIRKCKFVLASYLTKIFIGYNKKTLTGHQTHHTFGSVEADKYIDLKAEIMANMNRF
jgi:hypothetical protein